jgi:hypothetical protein
MAIALKNWELRIKIIIFSALNLGSTIWLEQGMGKPGHNIIQIILPKT